MIFKKGKDELNEYLVEDVDLQSINLSYPEFRDGDIDLSVSHSDIRRAIDDILSEEEIYNVAEYLNGGDEPLNLLDAYTIISDEWNYKNDFGKYSFVAQKITNYILNIPEYQEQIQGIIDKQGKAFGGEYTD